MPDPLKIKTALISVYDKTGIVDFARALHGEFGIEIISTGGTAKTLRDAGIPVTLIEEITGFPEMLDGRVKTLHPAIHAGILADRDNPEHMRQLAAAGIRPIDMVVVNLYPFERTVADPNCTFEQAIEMIDIGGVTLLRAAAKNSKHVFVIYGLRDYDVTVESLRQGGDRTDWSIRGSARDGIGHTAWYDSTISMWLSRMPQYDITSYRFVRLFDWGPLRYGENSHQVARLLGTWGLPETAMSMVDADMLGYQPIEDSLSHNNYLDADAALGLCAELTRAAVARPGVWGGFATRHVMRVSQPASGSEKPRITGESYYHRRLPHIERAGSTYFVTFRLETGQMTDAERDVALSACKYWHGRKMTLHAVCVMPDHVHMLMTPHDDPPGQFIPVAEILQSIKRFSAHEINKLRGTTGRVWKGESWDRVMRHEREFMETGEYMEANPVTAGIVKSPGEYRWFWRSDAGFEERVLHPPGSEEKTDVRVEKPAVHDGLETRPTNATDPTDTSSPKDTTRPTGTPDSIVPARQAPSIAVFIKHTNSCGVGIAGDPVEAYRRAYLGDPNAAMGGILAVNFDVQAEFAKVVMETYDRFGKLLKEAAAAHAPGGFFVEVWVAPAFDDEAVKVIRTRKKWGENVRLLAVGDMARPPDPAELQYRSIAGGMLVQTPDVVGLNEDQWKAVTKRAPTDAETADLRLAWLICKHTKSNAISIVQDGMLLGNGAGQMSRVMSCRIATWLARENGHLSPEEGNAEKLHAAVRRDDDVGRGDDVGRVSNPSRSAGFLTRTPAGETDPSRAKPRNRIDGPVAASDAFFPFADGPKILIDAGVTALIQPGGSKRDADTIQLCDERGVAMIFTGTRHFKH